LFALRCVHVTTAYVQRVATCKLWACPTSTPIDVTVLKAFRLTRHSSFRRAITEMEVEDNGIEIAKDLVQGSAIAVSDGSFKNQQGTAAFIIEGTSSTGRLIGVNIIPGASDSQSPYRSELGGITGTVEALHCICVIHRITQGAVEVGLDGNHAMKEAFGNWPLDPSRPDCAMLQHIRGMIKASALKFTSKWIESHQDDHTSLSQIDHRGQLNVECDGLAKGFWNSTVLTESWVPSIQFGFKKWSLWIAKQKLAKVDKRQLYAFVFSETIENYWHRKHSLTPDLITSINWEACEEAMGRLPFGKKRWLIKHATGFCGVGRRGLLRGNQDHDDCPRCGFPESSRHVLECHGTGADATFALALQKLETGMISLETAPPITQAIISRLR
jgi:hypothetical protein